MYMQRVRKVPESFNISKTKHFWKKCSI